MASDGDSKKKEFWAQYRAKYQLQQQVYRDPEVRAAYAKAAVLRHAALESAETRYRAERPGISFGEFIRTGQALIDLERASLESAQIVIPATARAWRRKGFTGRELSALVDEEIEGATNSLNLSMVQQQLVNMEIFALLMGPEFQETEPVSPEESAPKISPVTVMRMPLTLPDQDIERSKLYEACKEACRSRGVRLSQEMLAREAKSTWSDRTQVKWWKANDPRSNKAADRLIREAIARLMGNASK